MEMNRMGHGDPRELGRPLAAPPQAMMELNAPGATLENSQTECIGKVYEVCCCACAACGVSGNLVTVDQGFVGLVSSFGRYSHMLDPGRHRFNIMSETVGMVNMKSVSLDLPPQLVMTKDNLEMKIDAVCIYNIFDPEKAMFSVENYSYALSNLAMVTLRTVAGEHTLAETFAERTRINQRITQLIDEASDPWGIKVQRVELKGLEISETMQRAMAARAEADQEAQAKIIAARAQRDAASILAEAAEKMAQQPSALRLQWFETLRIIATQGKNSTVIVPDGFDNAAALAAQSKGSASARG
jgi:regulator of protease activity HflC (stomatin/prohibitin superfamily)